MVPLAFCFMNAPASQAIQSDWSGGPSAQGPAASWTIAFSSSVTTAWCSIPGQLQLSSVPVSPSIEHQIAGGIQNPYSACVADLNGDGCSDIVCGSAENDGVTAYFGSQEGEWTAQQVSASSPGAIGLTVSDLNGDGLPDIAVCAVTELHVLYNGGGSLPSWTAGTAGSGYLSLHDVEAVDMDEDGDNDLVVSDCDGDRLFWLRNEGDDWTDLTIAEGIDYPCKQHAADINGDGCIDVACAAWTGGQVMAFYGSGGSDPSWVPQTVDPDCVAAHGTRVCDVDDDGDMDILGASINEGRLLLYRNQGGTSPSWEKEEMGIIGSASMVRVGDVDGDGDQDATASSWGSAGVAWWENDGSGTFARHVVKTGGQATSWAMPGDIDNDGDLDILAVRYTQGSLFWYEVTEFVSTGELESLILDTGDAPQWCSFDWDASVPAGCVLSFQFRSSDDPSSMGDWSEVYCSPAVLSGEVLRYFQYRLNLDSQDPLFSPVVRSIALNWDAQGTGDTSANGLIACSNPCRGVINLFVSGEPAGVLSVDLYSSAGRLVLSRSVGAGESLSVDGLASGLYLYRATGEQQEQQLGSIVLLAR